MPAPLPKGPHEHPVNPPGSTIPPVDIARVRTPARRVSLVLVSLLLVSLTAFLRYARRDPVIESGVTSGVTRDVTRDVTSEVTSDTADKPQPAPQTYPVEPWRVELYHAWKKLPRPPITPYSGPFGGDARAFVGKPNLNDPNPVVAANYKAQFDWTHTAPLGVYEPDKDPRPINVEFEKAMLEDWHRMGYNCAYKGSYFTFMVGAYLKQQGLLGAIDQTLFGQNGPPPVGFDGTPGRRQSESCGSFFHPDNYQAGVAAITGMGQHYGKHLFSVGDHKLTCSWDEVGMRTRAQLDYHPATREEFRQYLQQVWFQDAAPDQDTNQDGRTYNSSTGEQLTRWDQVEPLPLSLDWAASAWHNDGSPKFSARPEIDAALFAQPGRYKLWIDFHRYFTIEFFRRINEDASLNLQKLGDPGRVTCYPFVQHFIIWPGMNYRFGMSNYWYHRLSPVVNVEHCWPDSPAMTVNYGITDRLAPRWQNTVMGWVWFYFGHEGADMYNGPHDIDRALARIMGHAVDGTHHWLYSPIYRGRDQSQRLQIAYWQNFLASHYPSFLARSAPPQPQVAVLMPDWTGYFYRVFQYPKQDWAYTIEALQNLQYPYHIITEEELELHAGTLQNYKVLYVIGSEWSTPTIRRRISDFLAGGGVVFANVDSLSLDIPSGERIDYLEQTFGVKIEHKYKNCFYPATQSMAEAEWALAFDRWNGVCKLQGHSVHRLDDPRAWAKLYQRTPERFQSGADGKPQLDVGGQPIRDPAYRLVRDAKGKLVRDETAWQEHDEQLARMPREVRSVAQSPLDMRQPPQIRYDLGAGGVGSTTPAAGSRKNTAVTWGEVDVVRVLRGKPIAWWGDKVCGVETRNTVWLGTREGVSVHALSPRMSMHQTTEPCNPYPTEIPDSYEARRPYVEALGHAAVKAGVSRPVTLLRNGRLPLNLEILPRLDEQGTLMVIVINHDPTEATYQVEVDRKLLVRLHGGEAWDMLREQTIETPTDGKFTLAVPAWGVSVFMLGTPARLQPIKARQAELNQRDLSVPQYFRDRPELNAVEYDTPVPPLER